VTPFTYEYLLSLQGLGALSRLKPRSFPSVVVVATAQNSYFSHNSIYNGGAYETPLGRVFVDLDAAVRAGTLHPRVIMSANGHLGGKAPEHVTEVLLPWLQLLLGDFRIVPIVAGCDDAELAEGLGEVLAHPAFRNTLVIACTNIVTLRKDIDGPPSIGRVLGAISDRKFAQLRDQLANSEVVGQVPLLAAVYAASRRGVKEVKIFESSTDNDEDSSRIHSMVMLR
jgi:AmmeMemoRadiSam system protein B